MKKILAVFAMLLISNACFAAEIDRKIVLDTTVAEVEQVVLDVINQYEGVITTREIDKQKHMYVVDYNTHTYLSVIGVSNDKWATNKFAKAAFSCQLKPVNDGKDTLITMRKHSYGGGMFGISTFNHYKKVYQELKFNGKELKKVKK